MTRYTQVGQISLSYSGSPLSRQIADFNGDGQLDLIFGGPAWVDGWVNQAQAFQFVSISLQGALTNNAHLINASAVHAREGIVADFNRDGIADFFSANHGYDVDPFPGETSTLFVGGAAGSIGAEDFTHSADAGDVDGDGDIDIFVGNMGQGGSARSGAYMLRNDGTGNFTKDYAGITPVQMTASKLVDVDSDGDLDLVAGGLNGATWVYRNTGGHFQHVGSLPGAVLPTTTDIAAFDMDGDGDRDLVLAQTGADYQGSVLQVLRNDGGNYVAIATLEPGGAWIENIYVADINGDGRGDLITSTQLGDAIYLNTGGSFSLDQVSVAGVKWMPLDYNSDGRIDLLTFSRDLGGGELTIRVFQNGSAPAGGFVGSEGPDHTDGTPGNDVLRGLGGEDRLWGGDGDDLIYGGDAWDFLHGNRGNDTVHGGLGGDWVVGGQNNDMLYGDEGDDYCLGNLGVDHIYGGAGNDTLLGGQEGDFLFGGDGSDLILGDRGDDLLSGGGGADTFRFYADVGRDRITDFSLAEGDRIEFAPGATYSIQHIGGDTVINHGNGDTITLVGVVAHDGAWIVH